MLGEAPKLITVRWSIIRDETTAYVLEFTDGQLSLTFGPMPMGIVETFLIDRKKQVAEIFDRAIERLSNGKNSPQENQAVSDPSVRRS